MIGLKSALVAIRECQERTGLKPRELLCDHWTWHRLRHEITEKATSVSGSPYVGGARDAILVAGIPITQFPGVVGFRAVRQEPDR